jgi:integrase
MALHLRKRGEVWHARGTVRVGRESLKVAEFSTGCRARTDAEAAASAEEARVRQERLDGPAGRARRLTVADAFLAYLKRPGGIPQYDKDRLADIGERIGTRPLAEAAAAWSDWLHTRGAKMAPATAARWRAIYVAALKVGCAELKAGPPPAIPTIRQREEERVVHLRAAEREALIRAYNPSAAAPALLLAYAGLRTQEALQLDWSGVDLERSRLYVRASSTGRTKSSRGRMVPMHRRVSQLLWGLWEAAGRPARGPVFLSSRGAPYTDTRALGGNPLAKAHETACRAAGVEGFRVHDWRHDFALRFLAEGGDIRSLMQVMGWRQMRMAERYVTYRGEHLAEIMARVA